MAKSTKTVENLLAQYKIFSKRPRENPDEVIDEVDDIEAFYRHLEGEGVDLGNPTDEEMVEFLEKTGMTDPDTQCRVIEMAAEWHRADADGRPEL